MALPGTRFHTPAGASLTGVSFSSKHDRKNVQSMLISQERRRDALRRYRLSLLVSLLQNMGRFVYERNGAKINLNCKFLRKNTYDDVCVTHALVHAGPSGISVQKQREKSYGGGKKIKQTNGTCCQRHDLLFYQYFMSAFPNISWVEPSHWWEISLWSLIQFLSNWTKVNWKVFFCVWEVINMVNSAPSRMRVPRASLHIRFLLTATHGLESNTFPFVTLQVLNFWLLAIRQLQCRAVGGGRRGTVSTVIMKRKKKKKGCIYMVI